MQRTDLLPTPIPRLESPTGEEEAAESFDATDEEVVLIFDAGNRLRNYTARASLLLGIRASDLRRRLDELAPRLGGSDPASWLGSTMVTIDRQPRIRIGRVIRATPGSAPGLELRYHDPARHPETFAHLLDRNRQHAFVADLGRHALEGESPDRLLERACAGLADALRVEFSKVLRLDGNRQEFDLVAGVGWRPGIVGSARVSAGLDSQAGFTLLTPDPVIVDDLGTELRFNGPSLLLDHGVVSGMSVIIGEPSSPWGVLSVHTTQRRSFLFDEANFLRSVANVLAAALKRAEMQDSLARSESRMRLVLDSLPALVSFFDRSLHFRFCNLAYSSWFGLPHDEILKLTLPELVGEEAFERIRDKAERALAGGRTTFETSLPDRLGGRREVLAHCIPHHRKGEVDGFFALVQDVTEQKQREQQLRILNEELESRVRERTRELEILSGNVPAFFSLVDRSLRYRFVNRAYTEAFGLPADQIRGVSVGSLLGSEAFQQIGPRLVAALEGSEQNYTVEVTLPARGPVVLRARHVPHRDADGRIVGVFVLAQDITRERKLERAIVEAADREREALARDLHDSLGQELGGIGMLAKALENELARKGRPEADPIREIGTRIRQVADQTRRIAHGLSLLPAGDFDLESAIRTLLDSFRSLTPDREFEFRAEESTADRVSPEAQGQLFLICREAVSNAVRHAHAQRIEVELRQAGSSLLLSIRDDGAEGPDSLDPMSGLGLRSMCYRANFLGGDLAVSPRKDSPGTEVLCRIPHPQPKV